MMYYLFISRCYTHITNIGVSETHIMGTTKKLDLSDEQRTELEKGLIYGTPTDTACGARVSLKADGKARK